MSGLIRACLSRKLAEILNLDPGNLRHLLGVSGALQLRRTDNGPEFHLDLKDLQPLCPNPHEAIDKLPNLRSDTITKAQFRLRAPKREQFIFQIDKEALTREALSTKPSDTILRPESRRVIVEFSSPNIAKPFHVGHLRSTIIGSFLSNLYAYLGHTVTRLNYLGDWGTQFGLLKIGVDLEALSDEEIRSDPIRKLYAAYVKANQLAETDPTITARAREVFQQMEEGRFEDLQRWEMFRGFTVAELTRTYERLGVRFDEYHWESMYGRTAIEDVIRILEEKAIITTDEEGKRVAKVGDRVVPVLKSDGTTLYITRDIAAFLDRQKRFQFDEILYVVDEAQSDHFRALFEILRQLEPNLAGRGQFIRFGRIRGMSTRRGTAVFLQDILDEARDIMLTKQRESVTTKIDLSGAGHASTEVLGVSAVVVNDLKKRRGYSYDFSWDLALQANGDTGVKLQYTHCRLCSLEQNSGAREAEMVDPRLLAEPEALSLICEIARHAEVVQQAAQTQEANVLVKHLFALSNCASKALKTLNVKHEGNEEVQSQRLLLFNTARRTLRTGMEILGLKPLTEM